jgi:hypothetical protein
MSRSLLLTPEQYDILWEDLRLGEFPFPLVVQGHGTTMDERQRIRARVYRELAGRGLADLPPPPRPGQLRPGMRPPSPTVHKDLVDVLILLGRPPVSLDMVWLPDRDAPDVRNALVVASGDDGVLAELEGGTGLRIMPVRASAIVPALLHLLPPVPPARGYPVTVPVDALTPAGSAQPVGVIGGGADFPEGDPGMPVSVLEDAFPPAGSGGTVGRAVRAVGAFFEQPRLRGGQIGVNTRDRTGRRRRSTPLEWFDTVDGRCIGYSTEAADGRTHLTVAPADDVRMAARLHDLIDHLLGR